MRLAVRFQLRLQAKGSGAEITLVGFLFYMDPTVSTQTRHVSKGFAAHLTFKRPVSRVQGGVAVKTHDGEKRLPAI